jgi:hypothetical protein
MREEMYGWMALHLKGEGDGTPIPEPEIKTEDPEALRVWPGDTRPKDYVTIPRFAAAEAKKLLAATAPPDGQVNWRTWADARRKVLVEKTLGGFPKGGPVRAGPGAAAVLPFEPEPGATAHAWEDPARTFQKQRLVVVVGLDGWKAAADGPLVKGLQAGDTAVVVLEPRGTGTDGPKNDRVGRSPDHNSAEWGLWVGRPLLGQWAYDVKRFLDLVEQRRGKLPAEVVVVGEGPAGLVALAAAATDPRVTKASAVGSLASFVSEVPYTGQRLGVFAPGILRDVGDVAHLAALAAPRRVVIAGAVSGGGPALTADQLRDAYRPARTAWDALGAGDQLVIVNDADPAKVAAGLR